MLFLHKMSQVTKYHNSATWRCFIYEKRLTKTLLLYIFCYHKKNFRIHATYFGLLQGIAAMTESSCDDSDISSSGDPHIYADSKDEFFNHPIFFDEISLVSKDDDDMSGIFSYHNVEDN